MEITRETVVQHLTPLAATNIVLLALVWVPDEMPQHFADSYTVVLLGFFVFRGRGLILNKSLLDLLNLVKQFQTIFLTKLLYFEQKTRDGISRKTKI